MAFWKNIMKRLPLPVATFTPNVTYIGGNEELQAYYSGAGLDLMTPASLWRTQPHLRTVVSFIARNTAQLGLHTFERVNDTDRQRDHDSLLARLVRSPDGVLSPFDMIYALVGDLLLYDRAYWFVAPNSDRPTGWIMRRLPPSWVQPLDYTPFEVNTWQVTMGDEVVEVPNKFIFAFTGYNPVGYHKGSPTIETLKETLQEQVESAKYRGMVWKRGGRVSAVLERPIDAPRWSDKAREMFRADWYSKYTGNGSLVGGTPILEDGMKLNKIDFSAKDQQFVEAAKLSLTTVAAAFHVNPTMIGLNEGANYSNVREFRKMLYGDTLGPLLAQIESRINTFLLDKLEMDPARFYVEFNIAEKLQGNFEEQTSALQSATGAPWMTRNEARARQNLPAVEGGDELITPLNVLVGGQASPTDSGSQNEVAETVDPPQAPKAAVAVAEAHAKRVRASVKSSGKWDGDRWNRELIADLKKAGISVTADWVLYRNEALRKELME